MSRTASGVVALILLVMAAPAAAQHVDPRTCNPSEAACDSARREQSRNDEAYAEQARQRQAEWERQRRAMLKKPPLPAESNGLLGNWRLADGQRSSAGGLGRGAGGAGLGDIVGALSSMNLEKIGCELGLGGGITFGPSTYSRVGVDGRAGGSIAYRSGGSGPKPVIAAIPSDGGMMIFEVASPDRIVDKDGCALVRVGARAANAAEAATTAPGNARTSAGGLSVPPAGAMQYGSYVCSSERVEVFYCRNDRGQPVPEIDNSCAVEYPDRPRRNPSIPVSAAVLKSDLVKQLATCTAPRAPIRP